jgi:hypothetical protein
VGVAVGHVGLGLEVGLELGLSLAIDIDRASQWAAVWAPSAGLGCSLKRSPCATTVPAESKGDAVEETARTVAPNTEATTRDATMSLDRERIPE